MIQKKRIQLAVFLILIIIVSNIKAADKQISEIRKNFRLINEDSTLISGDSIDLAGETSEGGFLIKMKDSTGNLRKMVANYYGEIGNQIEEFYIKDDKLFFCYTKLTGYNRPIYYDKKKKMIIEGADGEVFDASKSIIEECRYYFDSNQILIQIIDEHKKVIREKTKIADSEKSILLEFQSLKERKK